MDTAPCEDLFGEHAAALAAIAGDPIARLDAFAKVLEVTLAAFVVFATLAGTLGAYFRLERRPISVAFPLTTPTDLGRFTLCEWRRLDDVCGMDPPGTRLRLKGEET